MGDSGQSILVAERSDELRESLSATLRAEGWDVQTAGSSRGISMAWTRRMPDLVLLDTQIADSMVDRQLARWREEGWRGRLVLLGAGPTGFTPDDVVSRPVVVQELLASIADWLGDSGPTVLHLRHCSVDLERQAIDYPDGTGARLTTKEAEFLTYLAANTGRTVGRDELLEQVWGYRLGAATRSRSVDKMLARLRPKMRDSASEPEHIFTVYGGGYRFVALEVEGAADVDGTSDDDETPTNLPAPAGDFVGRADDVADLDEDLESGARVITIVGPGGVGKTRLALHQCQKLLVSSPPPAASSSAT